MRLKELREENNLSQWDVANGIQTSQRNIGRWENGDVIPSADAVVKLADFFQVSADYLLGRTDDLGNISLPSQGAPPSKKERELLAIFRQMTEAQQNRFLGIGEGMIEGATAAKRR